MLQAGRLRVTAMARTGKPQDLTTHDCRELELIERWLDERGSDLEAVALTINDRPRKVLGWKTPAEVFAEQLLSLQQPGVASTG